MDYDALITFLGLPAAVVEQGIALLSLLTFFLLFIYRMTANTITWSTRRWYDLSQALIAIAIASMILWFFTGFNLSLHTFQIIFIAGVISGVSAYGTIKIVDAIVKGLKYE